MKKSTITQEYLRERLDYNPETGEFTWLTKPVTGTYDGRFNAKYAGKRAGSKTVLGYIHIGIDGKLYYAHRLAWLYMTGALPAEHIDHKNGIGTDNRFANLREATPAQNQANRKSWRDGLKGVIKTANGWRAKIGANGSQMSLGTYATEEEAHRVYSEAARNIFGEFVRGAA